MESVIFLKTNSNCLTFSTLGQRYIFEINKHLSIFNNLFHHPINMMNVCKDL